MKPNERFTEITINDRKFQVRKFDAFTGSFMLTKLAGMIAPLVKGVNIGAIAGAVRGAKSPGDVNAADLDIPSMLSAIGTLSESDFAYVQNKCLRVCSEVLPGGLTPVLNENGSFGAIDLEDDTITVMALTAHALIFNVKGFFNGSPLASLVGGLMNTFPRG